MRTRVYIDGFNLFFGAVRGTSYKWLDLLALSQALVRGAKIEKVLYFTARVEDRPEDPDQSRRQDVYLRALGTIPEIEVYEGHFKTRQKRVRLATPLPDGTKIVDALVTEEKGSDANLAAYLVWDACMQEGLEQAIVISNDSDLQSPVDLAIQRGLHVIVVNPHRHNHQANHLHGSDTRNLRNSHLSNSQMPSKLHDARGRLIIKPPEWS